MPHILVIEDDIEIMNLYEEALVGNGYSVSCANTIYKGILEYLNREPDLIIMDLLIYSSDEPNGAVGALAIRYLGYKGPIVCITGGLEPIDDRVYERAEFSGKLLKPVYIKDILNQIERQLRLDQDQVQVNINLSK